MVHSRTKRRLGVSMLLLAGLTQSVCANPSSPSFRITPASFVPPAAPSIASSCPAPTKTVSSRHVAVATGYGTFNPKLPSMTALWSKKKGGASKKKGGGKMQVKLLKHVSGTGQAGDVILVTPAFFQNKLRPTKSAVVVSDDEVEKEKAEKKAMEDATVSAASALKELISDISLEISRQTGPNGQLFGGVGQKGILDELKKQVQDEFLQGKKVKIVSVTDDDGKKLSHDIKHVGEYGVTLSLTKDISTKFKVIVASESE